MNPENATAAAGFTSLLLELPRYLANKVRRILIGKEQRDHEDRAEFAEYLRKKREELVAGGLPENCRWDMSYINHATRFFIRHYSDEENAKRYAVLEEQHELARIIYQTYRERLQLPEDFEGFSRQLYKNIDSLRGLDPIFDRYGEILEIVESECKHLEAIMSLSR